MDKTTPKDRSTLKSYFKKGATPTEEQFAEWIDSTPNLAEDGQVQRTSTGWAFYPKQSGSMDIALYTEEPAAETEPPIWSLTVTPEKKLIIKNTLGETVLETAQDKTATLHGNLTVKNEITAAAYHIEGGATPGGEGYLTVPADKEWYNLPLDISHEGFGCRVYCIYASFRQKGTGLCRLTRVTAIWLNRMEQRMESPEKHWWGWRGSIRFRWQMCDGKPCLQIRSKKQLPSGEIHCRMVEMYKG